MTTARHRTRRWQVLLVGLLLTLSPGCATLTGLVTGPFTGAIDAPAQVYRHHRAHMDRHPELWFFNLIVFFPAGLASGALAGLIKGVGIDIQWALSQLGYDKAFKTYKEPSVWRPFTWHW